MPKKGSNNTALYVGLGAVAIGGLAYFLYQDSQKNKVSNQTQLLQAQAQAQATAPKPKTNVGDVMVAVTNALPGVLQMFKN